MAEDAGQKFGLIYGGDLLYKGSKEDGSWNLGKWLMAAFFFIYLIAITCRHKELPVERRREHTCLIQESGKDGGNPDGASGRQRRPPPA